MKIKNILFTIAVIFSGISSVNAAGTVYTDRTIFENTSDAFTIETFNSFDSEVAFHSTPLDVGDFTLSMTGDADTSRNYIDIQPVEFSQFNVDGTTIANVLTNDGSSLIFTFDDSIFSFGADFGAFNNGQLRTNILVDGITYSPSIDGVFWGIVSDIGFNTIEFVGLFGDGFGIDNVTYSSVSAVPLPAAAFLFGPALLGFFGFRRKMQG